MIRVLLADDHQMFIAGMKSFLQNEARIEVVGEALNGHQVLECLEKQPADVVVLDIRMPEMDGEATLRELKKRYPKTKVLILTMHDQPEVILRFLHHQANGYILKDRSKEELISAIFAVFNNNSYYPPSILNKVTGARHLPEEEVQFTERELEVLRLVEKGYKDREIADRLFIHFVTVQTHIRNMRRKVGVSNRMGVVHYAREKGILK